MQTVTSSTCICCLAACLSIGGCTSNSNSNTKKPDAIDERAMAQTTPVPNKTAAVSGYAYASVYDVPSLLNLSIDQITATLGKPKQADSPNISDIELERHYAQGNYFIIITYDKNTRSVAHIVASSKIKNISYQKLLEVNNLKLNNSAYKIDTLSNKNSGFSLAYVVKKNTY